MDKAVYCEYIFDRIGLNIDKTYIIPNNIYQTFCTKCISKNIYNSSQSWKDNNTKYNYYLKMYHQHQGFIKDHFGDRVVIAYQKIIPDTYKIQLWKYCVLYELGGIYSDLDNTCKKPINDILEKNIGLIISVDNNTGNINNCFIASMPQNPMLLRVILKLVQNIENNYYGNSEYEITGDYILTNILNKHLKIDISPGNYTVNNIHIDILRYCNVTNCIYQYDTMVIHNNKETFNNEEKIFGCNNFINCWDKHNIYN